MRKKQNKKQLNLKNGSVTKSQAEDEGEWDSGTVIRYRSTFSIMITQKLEEIGQGTENLGVWEEKMPPKHMNSLHTHMHAHTCAHMHRYTCSWAT